jgi:hypothetical protein
MLALISCHPFKIDTLLLFRLRTGNLFFGLARPWTGTPFWPRTGNIFQPRTGPVLGLGQELFFRPRIGTFLTARAKSADNFRRNSLPCGNLTLVAPCFQLLQWRLAAAVGVPGGCPAGLPHDPAHTSLETGNLVG